MNNFNLNFVTFFGVGNIKFAQITFSSALTCVIFYFLISYVPQSFWFLLIIFFLALIYSPHAINKTLEYFDNNYPKQIVINKMLGISIPLFVLSLAFQMPHLPKILQDVVTVIWFLDEHTMITKFYAILYYKYLIFVNFLLFRFFCIFRPFSISYVDKKRIFFGIILNDILAGIYCVFFPYALLLLNSLLKFVGI